MFTLKRKPLSMPSPGRGPARPRRAHSHRQDPFRQRRGAEGALPARLRDGAVRARLLLGRRAQVLGGPRRSCHGGRLCRRAHAEPDLRGGLLRPDRPQRGGARRLRPEARELRRAAEGLLGEPRPDARHAAGQRRRHAVPLRHLLFFRGRSAARPKPRRRPTRRRSRRAGSGRSPPRSCPRPSSISPKTTTSNISPRTRTAIAGSAAPASPARSARASAPEDSFRGLFPSPLRRGWPRRRRDRRR